MLALRGGASGKGQRQSQAPRPVVPNDDAVREKSVLLQAGGCAPPLKRASTAKKGQAGGPPCRPFFASLSAPGVFRPTPPGHRRNGQSAHPFPSALSSGEAIGTRSPLPGTNGACVRSDRLFTLSSPVNFVKPVVGSVSGTKGPGPYQPQTSGKAERFIQTALKEWAYAQTYAHSWKRTACLPAWTQQYSFVRPHSAPGRKPPASCLNGG